MIKKPSKVPIGATVPKMIDYKQLHVLIDTTLSSDHIDYLTHVGYKGTDEPRSLDGFCSFDPPLEIKGYCIVDYKHSGLLPECVLRHYGISKFINLLLFIWLFIREYKY